MIKPRRLDYALYAFHPRVEDEESLKTVAVVGQFADGLASGVDQLLADGVVTWKGEWNE